jgi:predicted amidohydrolase
MHRTRQIGGRHNALPPHIMFKLAMIQMGVDPGNKARNLRHASQWIETAANHGAHVVVLPEAMTIGWTDTSTATLADEIPEGEGCRLLSQLAAKHRLFLCSGLAERDGDRVFNSAVLIGPDGSLLLHHRKIHELEIGHDCYGQGDRLGVVQTPLGCIGVMICADAFAPGQVISRTLGLMGAEIILSPSAWAVPTDHDNAKEPYGRLWRDNYGPVARDFRMWIAGVSNVGPMISGPWAGRKCIGSSMLVGPDGKVVLQGPYGESAETILYAEIESKPRQRVG